MPQLSSSATVVILGSGQLAKAVQTLAPDEEAFLVLDRNQVDLTNKASIQQQLTELKPCSLMINQLPQGCCQTEYRGWRTYLIIDNR